MHSAVSQIMQFLRETEDNPSYLLLLLQYYMTHDFSSETEQLLSQLSLVSRLQKDSKFIELVQFFHYLYYKDVIFLESCLNQPSPRILVSLLITGLFYPQGVFVNPSSTVLRHLAPLGFCNSADNALDWLDKNEDFFVILNELVEQNHLQPTLTEEERDFIQQKSSILELYTQENLLLLSHTLQQWKFNSCEKNKLCLGDCLKLNLEGMTDKALYRITQARNELKKKKADFWYSVYSVVLGMICWEQERLFVDMEALEQALQLFIQCKHRKLVLWCLLVKSVLREDAETIMELVNFADEDCCFSSYLYFAMYQKKRIDFSNCIKECKNANNVHIAKKAVTIEMQRNDGCIIQEDTMSWLSFIK